MPSFLAIRAEDYVQQVSPEPFIGLPREELERLHGAIPVLALPEPDPACLPLTAYAAIHYNYNWLTGLDGPGTLGKSVKLHAQGDPPAFLDQALHALARPQLQAAGLPHTPSEWRCAGLLRDAHQLALIYIIRLHQRHEAPASTPVRGNTELQFQRASFNAFSQHLIDHLHAL